MPFRFKLTEPFEEGCRRIAREQIERAQCQLKAPGDPVAAVHETRKSLKRLRALLRLVRPALGEQTYREENAQLRSIGGSLSRHARPPRHARDDPQARGARPLWRAKGSGRPCAKRCI